MYCTSTVCRLLLPSWDILPHILQKKLGIPKDNCYAIGDSENDIPMLEAVPHSIAMGVCSKTILPYCSYRTTPVLEDGIANALKHYGLI